MIYLLQHQHGAYRGSNSDTNWLFMFRQEKSKELLESSKVGCFAFPDYLTVMIIMLVIDSA